MLVGRGVSVGSRKESGTPVQGRNRAPVPDARDPLWFKSQFWMGRLDCKLRALSPVKVQDESPAVVEGSASEVRMALTGLRKHNPSILEV